MDSFLGTVLCLTGGSDLPLKPTIEAQVLPPKDRYRNVSLSTNYAWTFLFLFVLIPYGHVLIDNRIIGTQACDKGGLF